MSSPAVYSPLLYKQRYEQLPVPLASGGTVMVQIHKYVNAGISRFFNPTARQAFRAKLHGSGIDMALQVDSGDGAQPVEKSLLDKEKIDTFARYVFAGKGAPEHCQIVLQLAEHWNLAASGLQAYADAALGLDCNGFVGNYLWHIADEHPHPWSDLGVGNHDTDGPDTVISGYFDRRRRLSRFDEMKLGRCYILGRADASGKVIDRVSGNEWAHIAITEPGLFRYAALARPEPLEYALGDSPLTWGFRPSHLRTWSGRRPLDLADPSLDAIYVVESTAAAKQPGLSASWYSLTRTMRHHGPGVFELYRESMAVHQRLWFQIAEVD
jgi:hypothetical protein